jgi:hypothetical protein
MNRLTSGVLAALVITAGALGAGCSPDSSSSPSTVTIPRSVTSTSIPTLGVVKGWVTKWCAIQLGISKAQLVAIMGKPTEPSNGQSDRWQGYGWQFNAFYDTAGNVRQLDINENGLNAAEKADLGCDATRVAP